MSTKQNRSSDKTSPSGPEEVFDPSGGLSLVEWLEKHRGPGKRLTVPETVSWDEYQRAMEKVYPKSKHPK